MARAVRRRRRGFRAAPPYAGPGRGQRAGAAVRFGLRVPPPPGALCGRALSAHDPIRPADELPRGWGADLAAALRRRARGARPPGARRRGFPGRDRTRRRLGPDRPGGRRDRARGTAGTAPAPPPTRRRPRGRGFRRLLPRAHSLDPVRPHGPACGRVVLRPPRAGAVPREPRAARSSRKRPPGSGRGHRARARRPDLAGRHLLGSDLRAGALRRDDPPRRERSARRALDPGASGRPDRGGHRGLARVAAPSVDVRLVRVLSAALSRRALRRNRGARSGRARFAPADGPERDPRHARRRRRGGRRDAPLRPGASRRGRPRNRLRRRHDARGVGPGRLRLVSERLAQGHRRGSAALRGRARPRLAAALGRVLSGSARRPRLGGPRRPRRRVRESTRRWRSGAPSRSFSRSSSG